jgi:hypothetical protein
MKKEINKRNNGKDIKENNDDKENENLRRIKKTKILKKKI